MFEKFAKGTKDFNILIQKAKASGAEAFYPTAYEGDQMVIARQLREIQVDFPVVYMVYASQPQILQIGRDADWLVSQTLLHDKINRKVTDGLNRAEQMERYAALVPTAAFTRDFPTTVLYRAGSALASTGQT